MVERVSNIFSKFLDEEDLFKDYIPTLGAEDFSYMLQKVPGALFLVGTTPKDRALEKRVFLHNPTFDPDEKALLYGVNAFKSIAFDLLI